MINTLKGQDVEKYFVKFKITRLKAIRCLLPLSNI